MCRLRCIMHLLLRRERVAFGIPGPLRGPAAVLRFSLRCSCVARCAARRWRPAPRCANLFEHVLWAGLAACLALGPGLGAWPVVMLCIVVCLRWLERRWSVRGVLVLVRRACLALCASAPRPGCVSRRGGRVLLCLLRVGWAAPGLGNGKGLVAGILRCSAQAFCLAPGPDVRWHCGVCCIFALFSVLCALYASS